MQFVILGLLLSFGPRSLYDLRKQFEAGIALFYSASTGSIKPALDTLVARGAIVATAVPGDPRAKREYRATATGEAEFHAWMQDPAPAGDLETALLSRMYFFALIPVEQQRATLERFATRARADLAGLEALQQHLEHGVPAEFADHARHQGATLDYGIAQYRAAVAWLEQAQRR